MRPKISFSLSFACKEIQLRFHQGCRQGVDPRVPVTPLPLSLLFKFICLRRGGGGGFCG